MRIITGKAKGLKLITLEGEDITRPTSERVKEAVFSMLQFDIEGRSILDLFAGSGQMALEALSRGASSAVLVDKSKDALSVIKRNIEKTGMTEQSTVVMSDYMDFIKRSRGKKFDIIFLDPPYKAQMHAPALIALKEYDIIKPTSMLICECSFDYDISNDERITKFYNVKKQSKYSRSVITIFEPKNEGD